MYSPLQVLIIFLIRLIQIYNYLILGRVLMSWIIRDPENKFYHFLYSITEPVLGRIRNIMPSMGMDFSPIIAYFILNLVARMLSALL
jgi:YggT family protein